MRNIAVPVAICALIAFPLAAQEAPPAAHPQRKTAEAPPDPAPTTHPATLESTKAPAAEERDPALGVDSGDPRTDPNTGRAVATWPKDRVFDFRHIRIDLDFPDINTPVASGSVTINASPIAYTAREMTLDSAGPLVSSVTVDGKPARFALSPKSLRIDLPAPVRAGQSVQVVVEYTLDFSSAKGEGLTWCAPREDAESESSKAPMIHAQGEAELNSRWFPCFDSPLERITSEVVVTCDSDFQVISNGRLASQAAASPGQNDRPRTTWHWQQDKPHAPYLVTLGIGKWTIIEVGGGGTARPGLSMPVYSMIGQEESTQAAFKTTPDIMAFLEQRFDEPFPWDKYAQVMVRCFVAGGMENTSATFFASRVAGGRNSNKDDWIAHEMGHQWFGDLVTCRSWDHLWLNEGWANYCEALWNEEHARREGGAEAGRKAYLDEIARLLRGIARSDHAASPEHPALISRRFYNPDKVFDKQDDPYSKGEFLLHMLREDLGDETFFRGAALYLDRNKFKPVETDDFRAVMEEVSGKSLEKFFDQWAYRPGIARLDVSTSIDGSQLSLKIDQTQRIDRLNPAYEFMLPVQVTMEDGSTRTVNVDVHTKSTSATVPVSGSPTRIDIDPSMTVLARIEPRAIDPKTGTALAKEPKPPVPMPTNAAPAKPPAGESMHPE